MHSVNSASISTAFRRGVFSLAGGMLLSLLPHAGMAQSDPIMFDDFSYNSTTQLTTNGWRIRTWEGTPGLANGSWSASNVSFVSDPAGSGNKFMRLKASTNVNGNNIANNRASIGTTSQAEVARSEQIYRTGTWATRMYFNDAPTTGPDGDTIIETFFGLTAYVEGREPYSEIDFEYLANGGWWSGSATPSMWSGTYRIVDWSDPSNHAATRTPGSLQGWHTLVMQVMDGHISFYIDGNYQTGFSGAVAPDYPMYLMFQMWFDNACFDAACNVNGYLKNSTYREYFEDIDWVYFEKDAILSTAVVNDKVASLRNSGISYAQTLTGGGVISSSSSSATTKSSSPSSVRPSSSSSSTGGGAQQCNWWGTVYAICTHINSGWGWQNNADCIGVNTCATLSPPYGVVGGGTASSSSSAMASSKSSSSSSSNAPFTRLIQAEAYTAMAGVQTETTSDSGGGSNVGWIDANDWLSYANINIPAAGSYRVEYRVASPKGSRLSLDLNAGSIQLGQVAVPATGGWQNWTTVSHNVQLSAGTFSLGLYAVQGGWNINWVRITKL